MTNLKNFIKQANELIFYLDDVGGKKLIKEIEKEDLKLIETGFDFKNTFIALKFLVIPFLSTTEIADLFKEHLSVGLKLDDIDINERLTKKLIFLHIADRDNCKKILKEALINNEEIITKGVFNENKNKLTTFNDWLKDYISNMGLRKQALERAQYFFQRAYFTRLVENEKKVLRKFFSLYDFLNTSSLTPEGFEDDLLFKDKYGRLLTTNKGKVVVLYDPKKVEEKVAAKMPQKVVNKNLSEREKQLKDLTQLASQYPPNSLERKAIEEEIERLNYDLSD